MTHLAAAELLNALLTLSLTANVAICADLRTFDVAAEIETAHFGDPYTNATKAFAFSPDRKFFAAVIERGRLGLNRPEDTLYVYSTSDVRSFLQRRSSELTLSPIWTLVRSTAKVGPIISHWKWLADSSGIVYLEREMDGGWSIVLAKLSTKTVDVLVSEQRPILGFDIADRNHLVFATADPDIMYRAKAERETPSIVGTGRTLYDLVYPTDVYGVTATGADRSMLWAVVGGKMHRVEERLTGRAVTLFDEGVRSLALAPDGRTLITAVPLPTVPQSWEASFPPPFPGYPYRVRAGPQDLNSSFGDKLTSRYVRVDLQTGAVEPLVEGPTAASAGWWVGGAPRWSTSGKGILLPGAYSNAGTASSETPCVMFINTETGSASCLTSLQAMTPSGSLVEWLVDAGFHPGSDREVYLDYANRTGNARRVNLAQSIDGSWQPHEGRSQSQAQEPLSIQVAIEQGLNDPPQLVATDLNTKIKRVILDPNPQLKQIALGQASVYRWKDASGRDWMGGLYEPPGFHRGARYPLVIQTHGFAAAEFRPSGVFPTAFAARALAASGILVLQVQDCAITATPDEGPCNVAGYAGAIDKLAAEGLIDRDRVGIIGFSRTCFYVVEALTSSSLRLAAASITDGVMEDYPQYLASVDIPGGAAEPDVMIGARPFGDGLLQWFKKSPLFKIETVNAPLLVNASTFALISMWGPYAALRHLHKPVDLIVLNTDEHVLTNPSERIVSQGGSVDWFRFWLQGHEDRDPQKVDQYRRWESLCDLQKASNLNHPTFCVSTENPD